MARLVLFCFFHLTILAQERIYDYHWESFMAQGEEHFAAQRYENAFYYFEKAIRWLSAERNLQNPRLAELYYLAGESLRQLKRDYDALPYYEQSLRIKRDQPPILLILGNYHYRLKDFSEAASYLKEYLKLVPHDREISLKYSYALARTERVGEARLYLKSLSSGEQKNCENLEDVFEEKKCLEDNLLANPAQAENFLRLIHFYEEQRNDALQLELSDMLFYLYGDKKEYALPLVFTLYRQGKVKKALEYLELLYERFPKDRDILILLADFHEEIMQKDKALDYRQKASLAEHRK
ncbi:MAG: tetratricopeptide repeat protein [Leptospiraceae bacterium]|nr:tetratricopeptide repeat protein [Leptospiraceae bacterium]MDW8305502.1 tetratricopeptide repeat protein [Leptospiraceae bacterium]